MKDPVFILGEAQVIGSGHMLTLLKAAPIESDFKTPQCPTTRISKAEGAKRAKTSLLPYYVGMGVQTLSLLHTVNGTYPTCQNNKEPSDPPLAKSPS